MRNVKNATTNPERERRVFCWITICVLLKQPNCADRKPVAHAQGSQKTVVANMMIRTIPMNQPTRTKGKRGFGTTLVLIAFALMGLLAQWAVRLDFGPDEPYHMEYIHILATQGRLPTWDETIEVQHPPLYHALLAIPWRTFGASQRPLSVAPGADALKQMTPIAITARRVLRFCTTLLGCLALLLIARNLAQLGVPEGWKAFLVAACAASPMMQYVCAVINNEALSIFYSSLLCLFVVTIVFRRDLNWKDAALAGVLAGGCVLIKQNTLFSSPLLLWALWLGTSRAQRWKNFALFIGTAIVTASPWLLFNWTRSGVLLPRVLHPANQPSLHDALQPANLLNWTRTLLESAVLPDWSWIFLPRLLSTVIAIAMATLFLWIVGRKTRDRDDVLGRRLNAMAVVAALLLYVGIMQFSICDDWRGHVGGRYLLNVLPWLAVAGAVSLPSVRQKLIQRWSGSNIGYSMLDATPNETSNLSLTPPVWMWSFLALIALLDILWWILAQTYYTSQFPS